MGASSIWTQQAVIVTLITLAVVGLVGLYAGRGIRPAVVGQAELIATLPEETSTEGRRD